MDSLTHLLVHNLTLPHPLVDNPTQQLPLVVNHTHPHPLVVSLIQHKVLHPTPLRQLSFQLFSLNTDNYYRELFNYLTNRYDVITCLYDNAALL